MSINDPISDMITRIRNANMRSKPSLVCPASKHREDVLGVLKREGYIRDYSSYEIKPGIREIKIELKYRDEKPVIREIGRVSKPGCRVYSDVSDMPLFYGGLGIFILSTSQGVMSDGEARKANQGGEILCKVF